MNRLICPQCNQPSYCASLTGPIHCANQECGALLLPGDEIEAAGGRRRIPRLNTKTAITVEYLDKDKRLVESDRPFLDVSVVGFSTVLDHYPPLGSTVVIELSDAGIGGTPWRLKGTVREVQPAEGEGFRVGIQVDTESA